MTILAALLAILTISRAPTHVPIGPAHAGIVRHAATGTPAPRRAPRVLRVPDGYPSIQAAIDSAANGDTILVARGYYYENVSFRGKAITLASDFIHSHDPDDILHTTIDGSRPHDPDSASVVLITSPTDRRSSLIGFTITHGSGTKWKDARNGHVYVEGGGILCEFSSPTIEHNVIIDNSPVNRPGALGSGGGGIRCGDGEPTIAYNVIASNSGPYGAGLVLYFTAAHVHDNAIVWNSGGYSFGGGGFWIAGELASTSPDEISNNIIAHNTVWTDTAAMKQHEDLPAESGEGGAMLVYSDGVYRNHVTGVDNIVSDNTQIRGPAIAGDASDVTLRNTSSSTTRPMPARGDWSQWLRLLDTRAVGARR
jgi:hypothetical protein